MSGPMCFSNPPKLSSTCGAGNVEEIAGLQTYVTGRRDSHRAILLIADAFGYEAPNLRKLADKVADTGFFVVVPDFLFGDPADVGNPNFDPEAWMNAHPSDKGSEDAKKVIAALKSKGYTAIGAAGFCWGGMVVVKLANNLDCIQAAVVLHPGPMTEDEINEVRVPFAILGAEVDRIFSAEKIKHLASILAQKSEVDSFVKIFPGTEHGWTTRYKDEDEAAVKKAEESHLDMLNWFTKYIK
ncbi:unnamed protein product [Coffea canephora]|uniref:Dienelactone hydrolase domain-containing protein n=1 Tax=Coffea canephora TaxID=49390 RepID=A0A068V768_COFCA|nr:unnamed protein product [Coffea canephora]